MKLLFLRGQVPGDRPKEQIVFDSLQANDDMWTQLAHAMLQPDDYGEIWYEKGERVARYATNFVERWVPRYRTTKASYVPDVVFARGGFPFQLAEAKRHSASFKIHYGAGERVVPKRGQPWDLVLTDTLMQLDKVRARGYRAEMFIKPAADNVFKPKQQFVSKKKFDVIYVANWNPNTNKGHRYLLPSLREAGVSVIVVGINRPGWPRKYPGFDFEGWQPRRLLPGYYAMAKLAVVRTLGKDSCPRVIPEALACNCPILVSEGTKFWRERYLTPRTGRMFNKSAFQDELQYALSHWQWFSPRAYYDAHLSLKCAARHIRRLIDAR